VVTIRSSPTAMPRMQGLVVRERGDTDTLDDHKLLWARDGPVHDDIEVPTYPLHTGMPAPCPLSVAIQESNTNCQADMS